VLNLFLYHLASGHAWFSCGLLFLLLLGLDLIGAFAARRRLVAASRLLLLTAVCVAAVSATPVSLWLAVPLLASCLAYALFGFADKSRTRRLAFGAAAGICVLTAEVLELPYHLTRPPEAPHPHRLYVLADSLAAGVGGEAMTWPRRLAELTSVEVRDLSSPGADTRSALLRQMPTVEREGDQQAWVLLCIGGNDMLGPTSAQEFGAALDKLLTAARGDPERPRLVLMLELPLIPWAASFGMLQRRLACKHGVILVPKRVLAGVILNNANVLDGLHLSRAGHESLAWALAGWLGGP
jgi:acyl-CoA thioesterase-1